MPSKTGPWLAPAFAISLVAGIGNTWVLRVEVVRDERYRRRRSPVIRKLTDDTLVVFLSDRHIGGDEDHEIFESPDALSELFETRGTHAGPGSCEGARPQQRGSR